MRTNIEIDDALMEDAMQATGHHTKRATVESALRTVIRLKAQREARSLRGTINWIGDLDAMRRD